MKNLIEVIAKALVDHPEEVQILEVEGEKTTVLELRVAKDDLGKVIGKQGKTARDHGQNLRRRGNLEGAQYQQ